MVSRYFSTLDVPHFTPRRGAIVGVVAGVAATVWTLTDTPADQLESIIATGIIYTAITSTAFAGLGYVTRKFIVPLSEYVGRRRTQSD